jgi:hypothetical protein
LRISGATALLDEGREVVGLPARNELATREVAFGAGSYFSIWLDDAQLELGKILLERFGSEVTDSIFAEARGKKPSAEGV